MFQQLAPLLKKRSFVLICTGLDDDRIRVNVIPKATSKDTEQDAPLLQPLTVEGEPLQLDEELPEALKSYTVAHQSIQEAVDATKKQMADAKAAADRKAKADAEARKNKPSTKAPTPAQAKANAAGPAAPPSLFDAPDTTATEDDDKEESADDTNDETEVSEG